MTPDQLALGDPIVNSVGMVLMPIPAGQFRMGSPNSDSAARPPEKPRHPVKITRPFYLSIHEVTKQQYEKVMPSRPWQGGLYVQDGPDYPATYVSWNDAVEFCRRLSEQEGLNYRLPTEAGNTPAVPEQVRFTALGMIRPGWQSTPGTERLRGRLVRSTLTVSARNVPTRGACTTCTAMSGNGARTGTHPTAVRRSSVIRQALRGADAVYCAAGRSTNTLRLHGRPIATTTARATVTSAVVSVWRGLTAEQLFLMRRR